MNYTKQEDKAILSRAVRGIGKNLSDNDLADIFGRSVGAIRQRRYVLRTVT